MYHVSPPKLHLTNIRRVLLPRVYCYRYPLSLLSCPLVTPTLSSVCSFTRSLVHSLLVHNLLVHNLLVHNLLVHNLLVYVDSDCKA